MHPRKRNFGILVSAVLLAFIVTSCHKERVVAPTTPVATAPSAMPTVSLTAQPSTIEKGQSATLTWSSTGATQLDLEPNIGEVQSSGSTTVTPSESTTYTLTAQGPGGTSTSIARVTVTQPPATGTAAPGASSVTEENLFETNIKDAYFDFNSSQIRSDAAKALTTDAAYLKAHQDIKITVGGHCDERGSEEYNLGLGDRRARAAKDFMVNLGISPDRINTVSFGKDRPFCTDHTDACWQENRRAHLVPLTPAS